MSSQARPGDYAPHLDLFVASLGEAAFRHASLLARDLRRRGLAVEAGVDARLKRAMETANKLKARWVLIVGDDEIAAGMYSLKNMETGAQATVDAAQLYGKLSSET